MLNHDPDSLEHILLDGSTDWVTFISPERGVMYSSPSSRDILGCSPEDPEWDWYSLVHPDDMAILKQHEEHTYGACISGELEFRIVRRDGSIRWLQHRCRPLRDSEGAYIGHWASNRDVTDLKNAERQSAERVVLLEALNDISKELLSLRGDDIDAGINSTLARIGVLSHSDRIMIIQEQDAPGMMEVTHFWDASAPGEAAPAFTTMREDDMPWIARQARELLPVIIDDVSALPPEAAAEKAALTQMGTKSLIGIQFQLDAGRRGSLLASRREHTQAWSHDAFWLLRIVAGTLGGLLARVRLQRAMEQRERRWLFAIEASGIGLWEYNIPDKEFWILDSRQHLVPLPDSTVRNLFEVWRASIHPDDYEEAVATLLDSVEGRSKTYHCEYRTKGLKDDYIWILAQGEVTEYDENGRPVRIFGVFENIDNLKLQEAELIRSRNALAHTNEALARSNEALSNANEALLRALNMKDAFLAAMSHELRTPLTTIIGLTEALTLQQDTHFSEKETRFIRHIHESGHYLLDLITDVLDVARIEEGMFTLQSAPMRIADVCEKAVTIVHAQLTRRQHRLRVSIEPPDLTITADARQLRRVVIQLLDNAIKFTRDPGEITLRAFHADEEHVCIQVQDNGIGIDARDIPALFAPFTKLDTRMTRDTTGTGMGLALVRRIVELHDETVSVESAPGQGSTFTITLPITPKNRE